MVERVILRRFEFPHEAELCASFLRGQGIKATADDALLIGQNPLMNIAYGGVKVRVSEDDFERATALLGELDDAAIQNDSDPPVPQLSDDERIIRKAHGIALFGLITVPGILHLYSLYLVLSLRNPILTTRGKSQGYRAKHGAISITYNTVLIVRATCDLLRPVRHC